MSSSKSTEARHQSPDVVIMQGARTQRISDHIVEIISDSGEGAQTAGQMFATVSAKMGNGVWTVEIIPAEIEPPARSIEGASGNRIRLCSGAVTNAGDAADVIIALNEQVLLGRESAGAFKQGADHSAREQVGAEQDLEHPRRRTRGGGESQGARLPRHRDPDGRGVPEVRRQSAARQEHVRRGHAVLDLSPRPRHRTRGDRDDLQEARARRSSSRTISCWTRGIAGREQLSTALRAIRRGVTEPQVVMNGNAGDRRWAMASGMEVCAMYPITPATSASHYLSEIFDKVGGVVHQAEDEIAAVRVRDRRILRRQDRVHDHVRAGHGAEDGVHRAVGDGGDPAGAGRRAARWTEHRTADQGRAGRPAGRDVRSSRATRRRSSWRLPPSRSVSTSIITARKIAETFRTLVVVLTDANLATGQQAFPRPAFKEEWLAPPVDQSPVPAGANPYDWDAATGLSVRRLPGQPNGMFTLTGLAHTRQGTVAYGPGVNQEGCRHRSLKLAAFQKTLKTPEVFGDPEGDLLIVGWGSTRGAIEEAVMRTRADGLDVSSLHLKFLQPMASGIREILRTVTSG